AMTSAKDEPATKNLTFDQVAEQAKKLAPEQVKAVHTGLQMLAGLDTDYALKQNGIGFNGFDSKIGHSLAESSFLSPKQAVLGQKILLKYKGQLGADLHAAIKGAA
ncbi:MAG TPA: hypothetical protein VN436_13405, partial [Holophaga sp.]|nr:hypothetical protein [Holophaga sp.]